jgi:two-component system alkaline phosphatase synthesis response regulator PhoP
MPKRILLCDDEIHILRAAEFKLTRAGYDVQIAADGEEAWELIEKRVPDILITDLQMPRLNGFELTQRVRQNPATRDLPVLMLTAKGFELSHDDLAEQWNVMGVIAKPFSPRELAQTVGRILGEGSPASSSDEREAGLAVTPATTGRGFPTPSPES